MDIDACRSTTKRGDNVYAAWARQLPNWTLSACRSKTRRGEHMGTTWLRQDRSQTVPPRAPLQVTGCAMEAMCETRNG